MELKNELEIVLITYNRKKHLKHTLESIFSFDSPVKDLDITILDNKSTDGSTELISEYAEKYPNLKHIIHPINIGGNGNIARAFEIAKKPYLWVICDDDYYCWSNFDEIEEAIEDGYDLISTMNFEYNEKNRLGMIYYHFSFLPCFITKTANITNTVIDNAMNNICNMFPHLSVVAKCINNDKSIYISENITVIQGTEDCARSTYLKGVDNEILKRKKEMFWFVGYINSCQMIMDDKKRDSIINSVRHGANSFAQLLYVKMNLNKCRHHNCLRNLCDIYCGFNWYQKLLMIFLFFLIELRYLFVIRIFKHPEYIEEWEEYFEYIKQEKKIKKLAKKYRGKRILLYGAGLLTESLFKNYDFSDFNIIGVADKRFKERSEYKGYKALPPSEIINADKDIILYSLYRTVDVKKELNSLGIDSSGETILEKSKFVMV